MRSIALAFAAAMAALVAAPCLAGEPVIEAVEATPDGAAWRFDVTVSHADEGWEHYADGWEVLALDGTRLGHRELLHPHVTEQPFTRALGGVAVPAGVPKVQVRAHDSVHGWGAPVTVSLPD